MKFLSKLFSSTNNVERELEELYISMFMTLKGFPPNEAKKTVRNMIKQAKEESIKEGTNNLPNNYGDVLLEKEKSDEKTRLFLEVKRYEGVSEEDIKWWWNMNDIERRLITIDDNATRIMMYMNLRNQGNSEEKASDYIRKHFPIYGDPQDTEVTSWESRPLPFELKNRINIYITKGFILESSRSFNEFIRKQIKKGSL